MKGYVIKIFLAGLMGSGKTTFLTYIDPDAKLLAEQRRSPLPEEIKAWGSDLLVSTSTYPNFGGCIIHFNEETQKYEIDRRSGIVKDDGFLVMFYDGCGQDIFYPYRKIGAEGAMGVLFVIDASREPNYEMMCNIEEGWNELIRFYKKGSIYGKISRNDPMNKNLVPPIVICCNKMDLVMRRKLSLSMEEDESIYQSLLQLHENNFSNYQFVDTSALGYYNEEEGKYIPPWGIDSAIDHLFKEIIEREKYKKKVIKEEDLKW